MNVGLILLAGGKGLRMGAKTPKQFMLLKQEPVVLHSLKVFDQISFIKETVIVSDPDYRNLFPGRSYALPGLRRQDSVWNGLQVLDPSIDLVCIHDAARPILSVAMIEDLLLQARITGASTLAMPIKFTVKMACEKNLVEKTLDRSNLWEIQTPQAIRRDLLNKGFSIANERNISVTDDVSLVELFNHPVKLVAGSHYNIKITTPEDMEIAKVFLSKDA